MDNGEFYGTVNNIANNFKKAAALTKIKFNALYTLETAATLGCLSGYVYAYTHYNKDGSNLTNIGNGALGFLSVIGTLAGIGTLIYTKCKKDESLKEKTDTTKHEIDSLLCYAGAYSRDELKCKRGILNYLKTIKFPTSYYKMLEEIIRGERRDFKLNESPVNI